MKLSKIKSNNHSENSFKLELMPSFECTNPVETVVLDDKQTGYGVVSEYVKKYWEYHCTEDVIVSIEISSDGENYECLNEIASPYNMYDVEYLNDWWEGEKYIRVTGIQEEYCFIQIVYRQQDAT